jgi:hypothetical protein
MIIISFQTDTSVRSATARADRLFARGLAIVFCLFVIFKGISRQLRHAHETKRGSKGVKYYIDVSARDIEELRLKLWP